MTAHQRIARLLLVVSILAFACNAPFFNQGGGGGRLVTLAQPQALLAPEAYAEAARALAEAIAELNRVQEQTLEHLRTSPTPEVVDADLVQTSAAAMTVAQLAEQLAASTASQAGGSEQATANAAPYVSAAQMGYLMVLQTQNIREDYKGGRASGEQVANMIGDMGGMLWSSDYFDPAVTPAPFAEARENPTSAPTPIVLSSETTEAVTRQMDDSSGKATDLAAWNTRSGGTRTIRITVPMPRSLAASTGLDPNQLSQMRTPEGQANADVVRVAAASKLVSLGGQRTEETAPGFASLSIVSVQDGFMVIEITVPEGMVFQSQLDRPLPYFADGQAGATSSADSGGPLVSKVTVADGQAQVEPPVEVTSDQSLITLEIIDAVPTGTVDATTRDITLTVQWSTSMANPDFALACFSGIGDSDSNTFTSATGETSLTVTFNRLRDTAVCHAKGADRATTLGESQVIALEPEGDDAATQAVIDAQATQDAAGGGGSPGGGTAYTGTFGLSQSDDGCNFSAAPSTGGTFQLTVDFGAGTAGGSFSGGGEGVRTALECTGNLADLTWSQSYTGTFSGTVDSNGNLNMTGALNGNGTSSWGNCHTTDNQPFDCPTAENGPYSYPISVTGGIVQASGSGSGSIAVSGISLATGGTWAVGSGVAPFASATAESEVLPTAGPTATRVADRGTGDVQITLIWNTINDLDLHVVDPAGEEIYFNSPASSSGGLLDVDANGGCADNITPSPVENVYWPTGAAPTGTYLVAVHYYQNCPDAPLGDTYTVQVLVDGEMQEFSGDFGGQDELDEVYEFSR
jgi:uncharacterized protein YfaP (DUF2135 family)